MRSGCIAAAILTLLLLERASAQERYVLPAGLKTFQTPYYALHTDLPPEAAQEAALRISRMAEEYHARTRGFAGTVNERLPFYLFRDPRDYYAAGGLRGTGGVFMVRPDAKRLMAIAGESNRQTWMVVQHEGFHQFADATMGQLPAWVDEGLAEYFGEAIWTGDGFVTGLIPPQRLKMLRRRMGEKAFMSVREMMTLKHVEWNLTLGADNYDMAWSMTQFLAHGEDGKYQKALSGFIRGMSQKLPWEKAWEQSFGTAEGFEQQWHDWWMKLPDDPTPALYTRATLSTLASFVARAHAQKSSFKDLLGFLLAAHGGELKLTGDNWLPPELLSEAMARMKRDGSVYSLEPGAAGQPPKLVAIRPDGRKLTASFPARHSLPVKITITETTVPVKPEMVLIPVPLPEEPPAARPPLPGDPAEGLEVSPQVVLLAGTSDAAVEWIRKNNAFGPETQLVQDAARKLAAFDAKGINFSLIYGGGLLKSGRVTEVMGHDGQCFIIAYTAEQSRQIDQNPRGMTAIPSRKALPRAPGTPVRIGVPLLGGRPPWNASRRVNIAIPFRDIVGEARPEFSIRMTYRIGDATTSVISHMGMDPRTLGRPFRTFMDGPGTRTAMPLIVLVDIVDTVGQRDERDASKVLSNTIPVILDFVPAAP